MIYPIHQKLLIALLSLLFAVNPPPAMADDLPNPYKLDLRDVSEEVRRQAIAHVSQERVTIVAFAGTDAPWRIVKDVGEKLAVQGIPVALAWANDEDENIQDANVIIFAKSKGRDGVEYSTIVGYINYEAHVRDGAVDRLTYKARAIHKGFFVAD